MGLSWLFNGPKAASARTALLPRRQGGGSWALCCAALCGKRVSHVALGLEDDGEVDGLMSCADFEASLIARCWRTAPQCLDQALASGVEAWALCAVVLARIAHDSAADAAGALGRALPLLHVTLQADTDKVDRGVKKAVALVAEGPQPLTVGLAALPSCAPLGSIRVSAGVQAWLRLCKPAALWNAAGGYRGFVGTVAHSAAATHGDRPCDATTQVGAQVVEALQGALSVQLTKQMVSEVWEALGELELAQTLMRRAGGSWMQVTGEYGGFVL